MLRRIGVLNAPSTATRSCAAASGDGNTSHGSPKGISKPQGSTLKLSSTGWFCRREMNWRLKDSGLPKGSLPPTPRAASVGVTPLL
jgi:hypothetical protein